MYTVIFLVGGLLSLFIAVLSIIRIRECASGDKKILKRSGLRLIFHGGLILMAVFGLQSVWGISSVEDADGSVALLSALFLNAASWIVPFGFAAIGASVYASALSLPKTDEELRVADFVDKVPARMRPTVAWLIDLVE